MTFRSALYSFLTMQKMFDDDLSTFNLSGIKYNWHKTMDDIVMKTTHLHGESKFLRLG